MEKKFLGKALIGKQVAQDITDKKGVLLMRSGTVLTEAKVALLQKYHIVQVFVKE
ncbi:MULTISPECIES: hypothetical protein [Cohnella]|uniref:Uncharacterized protein n=1 Tax=Cohnella phaseoli TaxID=456490 RepID=A0A3D9KRQ8_9BACL|nr:hypothetical protein [Cohnella phaseoli]RED89074.1 hypothetical protein DFP98_10145 [Cohnella phaseoli]